MALHEVTQMVGCDSIQWPRVCATASAESTSYDDAAQSAGLIEWEVPGERAVETRICARSGTERKVAHPVSGEQTHRQ
jgi:hypothetical protein